MNQHDQIEQINRLTKKIDQFASKRLDFIKPFFCEDKGCFYYSSGELGKRFRGIHPSSTATCTYLLYQWGELESICGNKTRLRTTLLKSKWDTADLGENNAYTTSIVLTALSVLETNSKSIKVTNGLNTLKKEINKNNGGITLEPKYKGTKSGFITWWALTALTRFENKNNVIKYVSCAVDWAKRELYRQLSYFHAPWSDLKNVHQLAFCWSICKLFGQYSPLPNEISELVLRIIFEDQTSDGIWSNYYPLFNFPRTGSAYVYHFELLLAIIGPIKCDPPLLLKYLSNIELVMDWVEKRRITIEDKISGWSITSDPRVRFLPVSWCTIEVLHVLSELKDCLAEIHRELVFSQLAGDRPSTFLQNTRFENIKDISIINSNITVLGALKKNIVDPIQRMGGTLSGGADDATLSVILFGPPGTSKTTLANAVAGELGWPLLKIDPSHFAQKENTSLEMKVIEVFSYLEKIQNTVVLLDEIDELVRERTSEGSHYVQRRWTTLMLPQLSRLRDGGKIVIIVATNHIGEMDDAAKRLGRFDMVLPVGPPSTKGKLSYLANNLGVDEDEINIWYNNIEDTKTRLYFDQILFLEIKALIRAMRGDLTQRSFKNAIDNIGPTLYLQAHSADKWNKFQEESGEFLRMP